MTKQRAALAQPHHGQRDQRSASESGADNENDQDNDHDMDADQEDHDDQDGQANGTAETRIKRRRLTQACDVCRKKKIKCDGLKPTCANCAKVDANCTYLPSMKKRGPRQGYIELLEKRLDKMEQMLHQGPAAGLDPPEPLDRRSVLGAGEADTADAPKTGVRGKEQIESRYFGNTSVFGHYSAKDRPPFYADKCKPPFPESNISMINSRNPLYGIKDEVPRKDILDHLIQLFFDSVYYQFPIIHPATFMEQYKEGKVSPNLLNAICAGVARFSDHPDVVTTPAFLAGEPFATNVRACVVDSIDIPTVSNVQALLFLAMYEYGAARGPRAWMFGGMAIRMAQELGLNREDSSPVFYLQGDWVMRETRRRTFWACFIMDVLASSSSGRPRMIDERDCEVLLPSEDNAWHEARPVVTEMLDDEHDEQPQEARSPVDPLHANVQKPTAEPVSAVPIDKETPQQNANPKTPSKSHSLSSFAYLIRILAILGKVSQYVNRPRNKKSVPPNEPGSEFSIIDAALSAWMNSIPSNLTYSVANADMLKDKAEGCIVVFMHVLYHTSVVLLHRPILAADKASFPLESHFVETSVARCSEAASKVSEVLDFVSTQSCPPRVFISSFFAYPVFTTATIHITNAFASDASVAARARRNLSTHVKILQTMKSYWAMADKFFYIIRDLYSIQSKISSSAASGGIIVPQVVSHNPHGCSRDHAADNAVQSLKASSEKREKTGDAGALGAQTGHGLDGNESAPRMVVNGKLASISSFLKSDSGLIALWRRATEMQVIDEANQEKRRVSAADAQKSHSLKVEEVGAKEQDMDEKELEEYRVRMNQLEIQEINQEFERQWKAKLEQDAKNATSESTASVSNPSRITELSQAVETETSEKNGESEALRQQSLQQEKRQKEGETSGNPRAVKQARVAKPANAPARANNSRKTRAYSTSNHPQLDAATSEANLSSSWSAGQPNFSSSQPLYQPGGVASSLQQGGPMQGQDTMASLSFGDSVGAQGAGDVNQHLMSIYAQQHRDQESISQSIDMAQNANIQRQQQQLQRQQQQAQMSSSLAFGPVGGFSSGFMPQGSAPVQSNSSFPQFQQQSQQSSSFSGPGFGPPLVYGSSYSQTQDPRIQAEPLNSIFDFAMPLGDLNFLSSSFQMTPMMMQESQRYNGQGTGQAQPTSTNQQQQQPMGSGPSPMSNHLSPTPSSLHGMPGSLASESGSSQSPASPATSIGSTNLLMTGMENGGNTGRGRASSNSKSPPSTNNISPGLHSFMMSDEAFADMQSTPDSLVRYLQHHHQQQQRQHQQQQLDMQPLLNQQNSLIYDDYMQWMPGTGAGSQAPLSFSPQAQSQPQQQQQQHGVAQTAGAMSSMGMDLDPSNSSHLRMQSTIPSFS
ncbi:hypothetical protein EMPS_09178 [Entomortierella parvispora]|uniref:Zn(2)-C6 fungal-type domain-containing protein n=1 Tax=Entomortierella parvispora TaxID=205924 RepID=A0A9P3HHH2_9FUNG|nr:hypothetical protein EMPS_09178 [Entomortierella parvispora]